MFFSRKLLKRVGTRAILCVLCAACTSAMAHNGTGLDPRKKMTMDEASALVYETLNDPRHEYSLEPVGPGSLSPEFYGFQVLVRNPNVNPIIDGYMVNPWNGEVWRFSDPCPLVESPGLKRLQEEIRKRHGLTKAELAKAHALKPFCAEHEYQVPPSHLLWPGSGLTRTAR